MLLSGVLVSVWISLKTAVTATVITFYLGIIAAWWMVRYRGKGKGIIEGILTAPLVLPPTVVGFLLLLALGKNGWLGRLLDLVGIRLIFSWYATVIAATVVAFPLMYKSALAAFTADKSNLIACARTLGASETTIFRRIVLPLAKSGLIAGTLLTFARALGEFGATLILAGSIPGQTQTIAIAIFFAAESGAMDQALSLVIILLGISLAVMIGVNYWEGRGSGKISPRHRRINRGSRLARRKNKGTRIELEVNIQKQLPDFLLDIAFSISSEETPLGILGTSGAGKTTLLRCIAGLETPECGTIILNKRILFDSAKAINLPPQERAVGLVFQDYALFPHLTVAENIAFGMSVKQSAVAITEAVTRQLQQVDLSLMGDRFPNQLSGGEQQRVALARALASNPAITLLDEPFSALDSHLKSRLLELLQQRLTKYSGLTLYVTHNLTEAYRLCPQLLIIEQGKAIAFGKRKDLVNFPPNIKTAQMTGWKNFSAAQAIAPQTIKALDWQCDLQVESPIPQHLQQIAIPSHSITLTQVGEGVNIFPVWLTTYCELISRIVLYLKLHSAAQNSQDYHLEVEITFERWQQLQSQVCPWYIQLLPNQIIMFDTSE